MILEAKSKPVKFRIRSGGEEHSSLDSLRGNFVWEDIKPLLGKRISEWLDRIDSNIAKQYKSINNPEDKVLEVYNVLFRSGKKLLTSNQDLFMECVSHIEDNENRDNSNQLELKNLVTLCKSIIPTLSSDELILSAEKYRLLYDLFEENLIKRLQEEKELINPDVLFSAGKLIFDSGRHNEIAHECIKIASSRGVQAACDFIKKNEKEIHVINNERFYTLLSTDKIRKNLAESWKNCEEIKYTIGYSMDEKGILSFSNVCLWIYQKNQFGFGSVKKEMFEYAENQFCFVERDDLLYPEKVFVKILFDTDTFRAKDRLNLIKYYPPAKYLLERSVNSFIVANKKFEIGSQFGNANHLDFYISNLARFRNDEEFQKLISQGSVQNSITTSISLIPRLDGSSDPLVTLYNDKVVMDCIRKSWLYKNTINPTSTTGLKNRLYALSDACLNIFKTKMNYPYMRNFSSEAYQVIGKNIEKTDPFRLEKYFILGLFESTFDLARKRMIAIEAEYIPAKEIVRGATNDFILHGDDGDHLFSIRDHLRCENAKHLEFFINNLLRFRNYDKSY